MRKKTIILCIIIIALLSSGCIGGDQSINEVKKSDSITSTTIKSSIQEGYYSSADEAFHAYMDHYNKKEIMKAFTLDYDRESVKIMLEGVDLEELTPCEFETIHSTELLGTDLKGEYLDKYNNLIGENGVTEAYMYSVNCLYGEERGIGIVNTKDGWTPSFIPMQINTLIAGQKLEDAIKPS